MPVRRPISSRVSMPRSTYYKSHDYGIDDSISQAEHFSNAVLDDTYLTARNSKNRDNDLLRSTRAAIRSREPSYTGDTRPSRITKRFRSMPASSPSRSPPPPSTALVACRSRTSSSVAPRPTSLLSTKINTFLRGSSMPPRQSSISYKSLIDPPSTHLYNDVRPHVTYLPDPPVPTRSSSHYVKSYSPKYHIKTYSPYDDSTYDDDYEDEDIDDYHVGSYKRKYRILNTPVSAPHKAITYDDDTEYDEDYEPESRGGMYSYSRPSGVSPLQLSSYDAPYDGSYEADMAEMYDYVPFGPSLHSILELKPESRVEPPPLSTSPTLKPFELEPTHRSLDLTPTYPHLNQSLTKTSFANDLLFDSIVSNTAARAREALATTTFPQYKNASLVLSVEGNAVSPDGKNRYGFTYYPPPIPIKGSGIGLDERILGITPKPVSPADSFLCKYLDRLRDVRSDVRDHVDKDDYRRDRYLTSSGGASRGVSGSSVSRSSPYSHQTIHMPVTTSGRCHSVPVSSYRSRLGDGQSHRVDVYPLVVSESSLPSDRRLHLYSADRDTDKLTVLEKINIKAAIIGSRMEAADAARKPPKRPRSQFAANKLREMKIQDIERKYK